MTCPNYLKEYGDVWESNPHRANMAWFADAAYGLFMHYGLYSQLQTNEWAMLNRKIPIAEYEKLAETFNPV